MGFKEVRREAIEELSCELVILKHESGARVVHLANEDPEMLFSLAFRTVPTCSDGIAHILEHTVLCGSEKFHVRDPFFSMIRRSLNTFMNAMTGEDITYYPAASMIEKDLLNLLDIYLDAVFNPLLDETSFVQERHIVFNEMKGALASPEAQGWHRLMALLYPDSPYRFNSGGEPPEVAKLTYEELLAFHRKYYHPSHCVFFFAGGQPLGPLLEKVEAVVNGAGEPLEEFPRQPRLKSSVRSEETFVSDRRETQHLMGWLTCTTLDEVELLRLSVIEELLCGTDAAPLKKALMGSGLCKEVYFGSDPDLFDVPLVLVVKGSEPEHAEALEKLVRETLEACVSFDPELIEGAIHQLEMERSEITSPYGLTLFRRSVPLLLHGGDPADGLRIHTLFERLRKEFDAGACIRRWMLDNPHFVRLTLRPEPEKEEAELEFAPPEEREEEDLSVLPKMTLADVPKAPRDFPLKQQGTTLIHECFTNQIAYAHAYFPLPQVADEDLPLVRLLVALLTDVGAGGRSADAMQEELQKHTGGIWASLDLHPQAQNFSQLSPTLTLSGKALYRKTDHLLPLMRDFLVSADFTDRQRLQELLLQHLSGLEASINHKALNYAIGLAAGGQTRGGWISQQWFGLDYVHAVRSMGVDTLLERLPSLYERIVGAGEPQLVVSGNKSLEMFDLPKKSAGEAWKDHPVTPVPSQGRTISSPVSFTCQMLGCVPYTHPDAAALTAAARLFENTVLHKRIREQGGAYGGGASANPIGGTFTFYAYRDPHLQSTLDAFREAMEEPISAQDLEEAILRVVQKLDTPISPGSRSAVTYELELGGRTLEVRQTFRDRLLSLTPTQVSEAIATHLAPQIDAAPIVAFADEAFFARETPDLPIFPV